MGHVCVVRLMWIVHEQPCTSTNCHYYLQPFQQCTFFISAKQHLFSFGKIYKSTGFVLIASYFLTYLYKVNFLYHTGPKQLNSLRPSDAVWRQRSGSTSAQVMACCHTTPSRYLNQIWLIISKVEWHSSKGKFTRDTSAISHWNYLENYVPQI